MGLKFLFCQLKSLVLFKVYFFKAVALAGRVYSDDPYSRGVSICNWLIDLPAFAGALWLGKDCGQIFSGRKPLKIPFPATISALIALVATFIVLIIYVPDHR